MSNCFLRPCFVARNFHSYSHFLAVVRRRKFGKWCSRPDLNTIRPCSVKCGASHNCSVINVGYIKLTWIQRYISCCMQFCCYCLIWALRYGFLNWKARQCCAAPNELVNVATRHGEAITCEKMSHYCPTFSGLWGPVFVRPLFGRTCW